MRKMSLSAPAKANFDRRRRVTGNNPTAAFRLSDVLFSC
jgi:hypothetical protein